VLGRQCDELLALSGSFAVGVHRNATTTNRQTPQQALPSLYRFPYVQCVHNKCVHVPEIPCHFSLLIPVSAGGQCAFCETARLCKITSDCSCNSSKEITHQSRYKKSLIGYVSFFLQSWDEVCRGSGCC
jgi:hypothetical protein